MARNVFNVIIDRVVSAVRVRVRSDDDSAAWAIDADGLGGVAVKSLKPDGTNEMPSGDANTRALFAKITDGADDVSVLKSGDSTSGAAGILMMCRSSAATGLSPLVLGSTAGDGLSTSYSPLYAQTAQSLFNGASWDRLRYGNTGFDVQGASPVTVIASAGTGKKNRIHTLVVSVDTAGLVTISDGIGRFYMGANDQVTVTYLGGKLQSTAATAITATNAGGGNLAVNGIHNTE